MRGRLVVKKRFAFTLVEIMTVVAIIGLLASVGIPSMMKAHKNAQKKSGDINIVSVEAAVDQYAVINNLRPGEMLSFDDIKDYLGGMIRDVSDLNVGTNAMYASRNDSTYTLVTTNDSMWVGGDYKYPGLED